MTLFWHSDVIASSRRGGVTFVELWPRRWLHHLPAYGGQVWTTTRADVHDSYKPPVEVERWVTWRYGYISGSSQHVKCQSKLWAGGGVSWPRGCIEARRAGFVALRRLWNVSSRVVCFFIRVLFCFFVYILQENYFKKCWHIYYPTHIQRHGVTAAARRLEFLKFKILPVVAVKDPFCITVSNYVKIG